MKFTPSSTARRRRSLAASGFLGRPQIPAPVIRIAPKPSRLTVRSPPTSTVPAAPASASDMVPPSAVVVPSLASGSRAQVPYRRPVRIGLYIDPRLSFRPRRHDGLQHLGRQGAARVQMEGPHPGRRLVGDQ